MSNWFFETFKLSPINAHTIGWICPKCQRVWSPDVEECWACNDKLNVEDNEE